MNESQAIIGIGGFKSLSNPKDSQGSNNIAARERFNQGWETQYPKKMLLYVSYVCILASSEIVKLRAAAFPEFPAENPKLEPNYDTYLVGLIKSSYVIFLILIFFIILDIITLVTCKKFDLFIIFTKLLYSCLFVYNSEINTKNS
jgi:amino acid transporter